MGLSVSVQKRQKRTAGVAAPEFRDSVSIVDPPSMAAEASDNANAWMADTQHAATVELDDDALAFQEFLASQHAAEAPAAETNPDVEWAMRAVKPTTKSVAPP